MRVLYDTAWRAARRFLKRSPSASTNESAGGNPSQRDARHHGADHNDNGGREHWQITHYRVIGAAALRDQPLCVQHRHAGGRQYNRQSGAEGAKQYQSESRTAERNRSQQKNERRRTRHEPAAGAESDQAAHADVAFRHIMRMRMAIMRVSVRVVNMMMVMAVSVVVHVGMGVMVAVMLYCMAVLMGLNMGIMRMFVIVPVRMLVRVRV